MKKNRLLINTTTWMNLTDTVLSQITIHKSYILYYFLKVQKQVKGIKVGGGGYKSGQWLSLGKDSGWQSE